MRKIKRISHLHYEQRRLKRRQEELEKSIRLDWKIIRQTLVPASLARETLSVCTKWMGKKLFS